MPLAIDAQRLLRRLGAGAEPKIAERAFLDLEQRRAPPLLEGGNGVVVADGIDSILRLDVRREELLAALPLVFGLSRQCREVGFERNAVGSIESLFGLRDRGAREGEEDIPRGGFSAAFESGLVRDVPQLRVDLRQGIDAEMRRHRRLAAIEFVPFHGELALFPRMRSRSLAFSAFLARASRASSIRSAIACAR